MKNFPRRIRGIHDHPDRLLPLQADGDDENGEDECAFQHGREV